jgi:hypothetical protein
MPFLPSNVRPKEKPSLAAVFGSAIVNKNYFLLKEEEEEEETKL